MFRMVLQETYEVLDCIKYDNGTITDHNDIWGNSSSSGLTRTTEYSKIEASSNTLYDYMVLSDIDGTIIEFDAYFDGVNTSPFLSLRQETNTTREFTLSTLGVTASTWATIRLELNNDKLTVKVNGTAKYTDLSLNTSTNHSSY